MFPILGEASSPSNKIVSDHLADKYQLQVSGSTSLAGVKTIHIVM